VDHLFDRSADFPFAESCSQSKSILNLSNTLLPPATGADSEEPADSPPRDAWHSNRIAGSMLVRQPATDHRGGVEPPPIPDDQARAAGAARLRRNCTYRDRRGLEHTTSGRDVLKPPSGLSRLTPRRP
jgi:hypothetical protein